MFYAVKKGREPGIYTDKDLALEQIFEFPFSEMRTFENDIDAKRYMGETEEKFYVVKVGREPGIYKSKEDVSIQVKNFPNPIVRTFSSEKAAKEFWEMDLEKVIKNNRAKEEAKAKRAEEKKNYEKTINEYLDKGISIHGNNICFIDVEANNGIAISLGAVIYSNIEKKVIDTFYSLMKYDSFTEMDSYCERINHITTEEVNTSKHSDLVINEFISFITKYDIQDIFSWGNNDKHFIRKTLTDKSIYDKIGIIRNIQTFVSCRTRGICNNRTWSLQDMKKFYDLEGEVKHNALEDAKDLTNIFVCFQNKQELNLEVLKTKIA